VFSSFGGKNFIIATKSPSHQNTPTIYRTIDKGIHVKLIINCKLPFSLILTYLCIHWWNNSFQEYP